MHLKHADCGKRWTIIMMMIMITMIKLVVSSFTSKQSLRWFANAVRHCTCDWKGLLA